MNIGNVNSSFSRKHPDLLTDELIGILLNEDIIEFPDIFSRVVAALKNKQQHVGGEEILRLRVYEKLQSIVSAGGAKKKGKVYEPLPKLASLDSTLLPTIRL